MENSIILKCVCPQIAAASCINFRNTSWLIKTNKIKKATFFLLKGQHTFKLIRD